MAKAISRFCVLRASAEKCCRDGLYYCPVNPDDEVCLCFHVSLRKIRGYLQREDPPVASLISDCLGAGTGCQWCVPFLKHLHGQHQQGVEPDLKVSPEEYARSRLTYRVTQSRPIGPEDAASDTAPEGS